VSAALQRWRLVLGRYAERRTSQGAGGGLGENEQRLDRALDYLYGREYRNRGLREGGGSLDASQLEVVKWLEEIGDLFPRDTAEVVQKHALDRYGMTEILTDPQVLERMEPSHDLLRALLTLKSQLKGEVLEVARRIIRKVVEDLKRKLESDVRRTLAGRLNRQRHSPIAMRQNFDPRGTVRANLRHFDRERERLLVESVKFFERNNRRLRWDIILCIDQSGSMADSVIHSAVMAGILAGLPAFRVKVVVFDTSVVDLSDHVDDPVEILMSVQLGGGTDIGRALAYCRQLVENPHRTVMVLVSDFAEGGSPATLLAIVRRIAESRVKLLGLASLDSTANPVYDRGMAARLAENGMEIAALTPQRLAEWLVKVVS
jgi:Mg-chelatase subunit ChlD